MAILQDKGDKMKIITHLVEQPPKQETDIIFCCSTMRRFMPSKNNASNLFYPLNGKLHINTEYIRGRMNSFPLWEPINFCPWCGSKVESEI